MICHYCRQPVEADDPRWVMGEPCCYDCHVISGDD